VIRETEVAIIGAGPYGLSIAAHLRGAGIPFSIFGRPMENWAERMPAGMHLKSDGFASHLYDPKREYTLQHHCALHNIAYADLGIPVSLELFVAYGVAFQKKLVPSLQEVYVTKVQRIDGVFELELANGEQLRAKKVVIATGLNDVEYMPEVLKALPASLCSHSAQVADVTVFRGKQIAVLGAGASATDVAGLAQQAGASVTMVSRKAPIFHNPPSSKPRSLWQRITAPNLGLGPNFRSSLCVALPDVFRRLPVNVRVGIVKRHLGPSGGWFIRDLVVGKVAQYRGSIEGARADGRQAALTVQSADGKTTELLVDHVIAGTGYRYEVAKAPFLDDKIKTAVTVEEGYPALTGNFESSVPGLYFVGLPAAHSFGPLQRFALGARFTASRITSHLVKIGAAVHGTRPAGADTECVVEDPAPP
jgi:cation diffusion facilitator CzcD-associated flavoprotein CzcO